MKVLTHKLVCVDDEFSKPIFVFRGKNAAYKFVDAILKEFEYFKKKEKLFQPKIYHEWRRRAIPIELHSLAAFVKNSLIMTMKKLKIIVT